MQGFWLGLTLYCSIHPFEFCTNIIIIIQSYVSCMHMLPHNNPTIALTGQVRPLALAFPDPCSPHQYCISVPLWPRRTVVCFTHSRLQCMALQT